MTGTLHEDHLDTSDHSF